MDHFDMPQRSLRNLTNALALCTSLTLASMALAQSAQAGPAETFFNRGFNTCDARLLAAFWGNDLVTAKIQAGERLSSMKKKEGKRWVDGKLAMARAQGAACQWQDAGYSYEQVAELAAFWGMAVPDAKTKVAQLFTSGNSKQVKDAMMNAQN